MLRPRVIPCLLVQDKGLVKTVKFKSPKYVGDPINAVRIFNEKEVDELLVLDIDASAYCNEPDLNMIAKLAKECRMPFCYGGGIKTLAQAEQIIKLGAEKIALSSIAIENPKLIQDISAIIGSQSVVVVLDVKKNIFGNYSVYTQNGRKNTKLCPLEIAKKMQKLGAGEIVVNFIDRDGVMDGYDIEYATKIKSVVTTPLTILGGAGSFNDIKKIVEALGVVGVSAGSFFVFKGSYKAVLISYLTKLEKKILSKLIQGN